MFCDMCQRDKEFLEKLGFSDQLVASNLHFAELIEETIVYGSGVLADSGALVVQTGEFTGRSPKDKFIVFDDETKDTVWWNDVNNKFDKDKFQVLYEDMISYLKRRELFVRKSFACTDPKYRLNLTTITDLPHLDLFVHNMFIRPSKEELENFSHDWVLLCVPGFKSNPEKHGTRQHNFTIIDFTRKKILIGGTGYTGEIKKSVFTVLNFILPLKKDVLSMHCSANKSVYNVALFFGLSGTGKTTLSSDPIRKLIGDDEHGWSEEGIFNFEGGCYAKCVNLSKEKEPEIYSAIKFGSLLENIKFFPETRTVNYHDTSITENTRVSYPINFIENRSTTPVSSKPENIFFLTADAFGVLPPISLLTPEQAMYYFISGYTAKVAGTEMGISEPQATFSACFGRAFLPLHPFRYAEMLKERIKDVNVWLVNTGWIGGPVGTGERIKLSDTREMINRVLGSVLDLFPGFEFESELTPVFNFKIPKSDFFEFNPRNHWKDKEAYDVQLKKVAKLFIENFEQYKSGVSEEVFEAGPSL